jgi:hypothetical protein
MVINIYFVYLDIYFFILTTSHVSYQILKRYTIPLQIMSTSSPVPDESNSSRHAYDKQIPTEQNKDQTQKTIQKQDQVPGEKRDDEIVTNFPEAAAMGRILMNIGFPANKNKIIQFVQKEQESNPECRFDCKEILPLLQKMEERQYENAFEVTKAAGLVRYLR